MSNPLYNLVAIINPNDLYNIPKNTPDSALQTILKIVFALAGAIAVLVIVIAGLRMTTSSGNPEAVNKARNTVIFAALGLVFCIAAFVIVGFVLNQL